MAATDTQQTSTPGPEEPGRAPRGRAGTSLRGSALRAGRFLGLVEAPRRDDRPGRPARSPRAPRARRGRTGPGETAPRPAPDERPPGPSLEPVAKAGAEAAAVATAAVGETFGRVRAWRRRRRARVMAPPPPLEFLPPTAVVEDRRDLRAVVRDRARSASFSLTGLLVTGGVVAVVTAVAAEATVPRAITEASDTVDAEIVLPPSAGLSELDEESVIFAGDGQQLAVLDREVNRTVVDFASIPEHVRQAFIAAEDRKFYEHDGYDVEGIGRALVANFEAGDITQGGSTITQQLAKDAVGDDLSFTRKIEELTYAMRLEQEYSKDEILGQYLNQVYFGEQAYGIAGAAEEFYGKSYTELTVAEAATLAGMVRNPSAGNPREDPETAEFRRNSVLRAMGQEGYVDPAEVPALQAQPLGVVDRQSTEVDLPFVVDSIQREFLSSPEFAQFGATPAEREQALYTGGLEIHSSIDPRLQAIAQEVLTANFPGRPGEAAPTGALAVVEPASGRIVVAQSALAYADEQFDIPTQGRRQPGSTYKPFVYAEALQQGFPLSIGLDGSSPRYFEDVPGWKREDGGLENYGGSSYERLDMRGALTKSVNTATVQLSMLVGVGNVVALTDRMGVNNDAALRDRNTGERIVNESIALGGLEEGVTPVEMASAYSTFANGGAHVRSHMIDYITDREGNLLYRAEPAQMAAQVLDPRVNATMIDLMRGVVTGGTGTAASIAGWEVAGKTGTTQGNKDAWFVGYTPTMATAMWMGYADENRSTRQTGGQLPARVWRQFMVRALEGQTPQPYRQGDQAVTTANIAPGQPTTVPDVRRLAEADATKALVDSRLIPEFRPTPSEARAGTVLWQDPRPGESASSGDTVYLGVSSGQPQPSEGSSSSSDEEEDEDD